MPTVKGGAEPAETGPTPTPRRWCQPGATITKPKASAHCNPKPAKSSVAASQGVSLRALDTILAATGLVTLAAGVILGGMLADHTPPVRFVLVGIGVLVLGVMVLCREEGL